MAEQSTSVTAQGGRVRPSRLQERKLQCAPKNHKHSGHSILLVETDLACRLIYSICLGGTTKHAQLYPFVHSCWDCSLHCSLHHDLSCKVPKCSLSVFLYLPEFKHFVIFLCLVSFNHTTLAVYKLKIFIDTLPFQKKKKSSAVCTSVVHMPSLLDWNFKLMLILCRSSLTGTWDFYLLIFQAV